MKSLFISLLALLSVSAFSQKKFQGRAVYKSKTTMDMNFGGRQMSEDQKKRIAERMKGMLEKTYTLSFNQIESIYKEEERLNTPGQGGGSRFRGMMSSFSGGAKYKNIKEAIVLEETEFFGKKFLISESSKKPEWKLGSETRKIGNYTCFKATLVTEDNAFSFSNFGRRGNQNNEKDKKDAPLKMTTVTAWYTPQIPVSQGPGVYWGLPGLILEISSGKTTILCAEITMNPEEKVAFKKPNKGKKVTRSEYNKIVTKKMKEMREQFRGRGGNHGRRRG